MKIERPHNKFEIVHSLLEGQPLTPHKQTGAAFAPSNIALIKYWGKRNIELNLPITSSLSISLGDKGAYTRIQVNEYPSHRMYLNGNEVAENTVFYQRLKEFVDLIKPNAHAFYHIETKLNLPVAAGLASSACGFAAFVKAFADLYAWSLPQPILSILCRLGSGSACRSLWHGFVEWHCGERDDGLDSFAEPLPEQMPKLAIGLCILSRASKPISSREAMHQTTSTSLLFDAWPKQIALNLHQMKTALRDQNFVLLGETAEQNALAMHATMLASKPAICYFLPATIEMMQRVWQLRSEGIPVYFTEDAGPNLKLLACNSDRAKINAAIPGIEWVTST